MTKGLVSIITPCYNGAKYIAETIDSVIAQSYPDWEMIIVDDGSTDETAQIVAEYAAREPRIRFFRQENAGPAAARNAGLRQAQGQYISLLDADDVWYRDFLERQLAFMREKNATCVCCAYEHMNERSRKIGHPTFPKPLITAEDMRVLNHIGCLTGLYDAEKGGIVYLKENLRCRDDYAHWIDVVDLDGKAYGNQAVLARYRVFPDSTTGRKLRLITVQYRFYRNYLKIGRWKSCANMIRWGVAGLIKFL